MYDKYIKQSVSCQLASWPWYMSVQCDQTRLALMSPKFIDSDSFQHIMICRPITILLEVYIIIIIVDGGVMHKLSYA